MEGTVTPPTEPTEPTEPELLTWLIEQINADLKLIDDVEQACGTHRAGEPASDGSGIATYDAFPSWPWPIQTAEEPYVAGPGHPSQVRALLVAVRDLAKLHTPTSDLDVHLVYVEAADFCGFCGPGDNWRLQHEPEDFEYARVPCLHLRLLALPLAGRDGYSDAWRV